MARQRIDIRVSKAVLFKDAFSEETVANGLQIQVGQGGRYLRKPGGYCLFFHTEQGEFQVEITSPAYQPRKLFLAPDGGRRVEEVYLYPSKGYPRREGCTAVWGSASPCAVFWCHIKEESQECRLLWDYQRGQDQIALFLKKGQGGRRNWFIWDKGKKTGEYFQVHPEYGEGEAHRLCAPLTGDYRKKNAAVYPAWECPIGEDGTFFLLFGQLKEQEYTLCYSSGEEGFGEIKIFGQKENQCKLS